MLKLIALVVLLAFVSTCPAQILTGAKWERGRQVYYDKASTETIMPMQRVYFYDEFLGAYLQKYTANENTTAPWKTVETALNTAIGLSADGVPGLASLAMDSDDNEERAVLYWGDNEALSIDSDAGGVVFEARVRYSVVPTGNADILVGIAGADNTDPDTVDVHAWFKLDHADNDALYFESDDGTTDDDDNDAGTVVATSTWFILKIDASDETAVKFYVDGSLVGTTVMSAVSSTTGKIQPYFSCDKASGTGVGTLLIDYVRMWAPR